MMNKYFAEGLGTFALVFAGTGAIIANDIADGSITHVGIAFTFGLIVMVMIYAVGDISGAHINPAVTIAFFVSRRIERGLVIPYILSQFIGAITASLVLKLLFPTHANLGLTAPTGSIGQTFLLEVILTFLLMFVILNVSTGGKEKGIMAGVAVGGTVALEALFAGPISGASMNPARSLAPAVISGHMEHLWIYLTATTLGALLAYPACRLTQGKECCS